ncbi:hypothetical protein HY837_04730 [archaeon]|nr:hypothetical protein [archaeon]
MEVKSLDGPSELLFVLGDSPRNRILDFLLGELDYDYTLKEIAQKSRVGYATIKRIWHEFIAANLVKPTRKIGKAIFYTYNQDSRNGKAMKKFYFDILFESIEEGKNKRQKRPEFKNEKKKLLAC